MHRARNRELSRSEIIVLELVAKGWKDAQIAAERGVTLKTIKTQVLSVRQKLGVTSRTGAVVLAHQLGILDVNVVVVERIGDG